MPGAQTLSQFTLLWQLRHCPGEDKQYLIQHKVRAGQIDSVHIPQDGLSRTVLPAGIMQNLNRRDIVENTWKGKRRLSFLKKAKRTRDKKVSRT